MGRTEDVPAWCLDPLPNVYTSIQTRFWDNQFLSLLRREPCFFFFALFMNILLFSSKP